MLEKSLFILLVSVTLTVAETLSQSSPSLSDALSKLSDEIDTDSSRQPDSVQSKMLPQIFSANKRFHKMYVLGFEDVINVLVMKNPEVSGMYRIRPDGYISLPYIDDVLAAGLTIMELKDTLTSKLSQRLSEPEVTVILSEGRPMKVYVMGAVKNPTSLPLREAPNALQAVAAAGGFSRGAVQKNVLVLRINADKNLEGIVLNLRMRRRGGSNRSLFNLPLQSDDILYVPQTIIGQVNTFMSENLSGILNMAISSLNLYSQVKLIEVLEK